MGVFLSVAVRFVSKSSTSFLPKCLAFLSRVLCSVPCFASGVTVSGFARGHYPSILLPEILRHLISVFVGSAAEFSSLRVIILDCELMFSGAMPVGVCCTQAGDLWCSDLGLPCQPVITPCGFQGREGANTTTSQGPCFFPSTAQAEIPMLLGVFPLLEAVMVP